MNTIKAIFMRWQVLAEITIASSPALYTTNSDNLLIDPPTVIIEVPSESTESYDRGDKFKYYQTLKSLHDYVLVAQDKQAIEHHTRQHNNEWRKSSIVGSDAKVTLTSIDCTLTLADIYHKVEFGSDEKAD